MGDREILPAGEMQRKYGLYAETWNPLTLNPESVPVSLRPLLTLASLFGIGDDIIRADAADKMPLKKAEELVVSVSPYLDAIWAWAGQSRPGSITDEMGAYLALASLCDELRARLSLSPVMTTAIDMKKREVEGTPK
jgi:hypothetical protein